MAESSPGSSRRTGKRQRAAARLKIHPPPPAKPGEETLVASLFGGPCKEAHTGAEKLRRKKSGERHESKNEQLEKLMVGKTANYEGNYMIIKMQARGIQTRESWSCSLVTIPLEFQDLRAGLARATILN